MKLKQAISKVEEKLKVEKTEELHKLLAELKKVDEEIKESEARDKAVEEIKRKNDQIEWVNIKDV
ncbi:MAG: hypothetical protein ACRDAG_05050 [Cetobacterium somerae]|uniref:Uncharacterized protein n=1 Tax=Cetobacterium somerae ATCC BAA-474 TaxID=1319815 RepID=U7UUK1_9FUSO|nr:MULTISPECIES: hypothetical protein [Cetobacterium]ERT63000.1 hypothetical protein HMPREF0202_02987 [Cetobacterium somerae ATCC BAA-474]MBC2854645.1 hypothetical protein [Cetobacterium sp. 2G large]MCQ9626623.1 hypothetical protein [Cetobacterium somerae]WVJ02469.1 hypothetical protein VSU16_10205 [Cetobacterium somerae]